jgi:hypothetical protein
MAAIQGISARLSQRVTAGGPADLNQRRKQEAPSALLAFLFVTPFSAFDYDRRTATRKATAGA